MSNSPKFISRAQELDWIMSKVIPVLVFFFGGSIQVFLAKISPWLEKSDPIIYSLIFFAGALFYLFAYYLLIAIKKKKINMNFAKLIISETNVNPLETKFEKKIINTENFFSPFYIPHTKKIFQDCHIVGTGSIFMAGCTLNEITFTGGQVILVDDKAKIINVVMFSQCHFIGGRFINCTLMMPVKMYESLPDEFKKSLPVISVSK